ncbi:MAG TPA: hypothetical protein VGB70_06695 [Allosphingosinicella sp.]
MNMISTIERASAREECKLFLDDQGRPSHRAGPDLTKAEPISEVIGRLRRARSTHAEQFYRACHTSGIDLNVNVSPTGEERLLMGVPMDEQEELRRPRYDALTAHLRSTEGGRQGVIDLLNMVGRFVDGRPYASVLEAAERYIGAGGRIYILPDGSCEETMPFDGDALAAEAWSGYPLRRLHHRYEATLRRFGAREELTKLVRENGSAAKGALVWERLR